MFRNRSFERVVALPARLALGFAVVLAGTTARAATPPSCPAHDRVPFCDIDDVTPPTGVSQLIYAPGFGQLVMKNAASAIATLDVATHKVTVHLANSYFTDMAISPSGRYVFAADFGGQNVGMPTGPHYVHRLDLATLSWEIRSAYLVYNVQAVADDRVVTKTLDQFVEFADNLWGSGSALIPMNTPSYGNGDPGYATGVYFGNIRYLAKSNRVLHGNSRLTSQEIQAFGFNGYEFVKLEGTGIYGTAQGYGDTVALATDESGFYYGTLEVDPLNVTRALRVFPEQIIAATGDLAFGADAYYDAHTAAPAGTIGFSTAVYGLNPNDSDFWAFDAGQNLLRHFAFDDGIFADAFGQ